ncbi:Uncharacterised protein [Serratia quinivorans]|uniref:hypothetical protein n=1 Tax=Serratia quinivorans TaxID=137545 RepID=UPI00217BF479|nr:hypothetical protein [Serratia quinivorans]CAI1771445.1 Uncharacterised protein [Serratia quinivorans]
MKTVHGMTRNALFDCVFRSAMEKSAPPAMIETWLKWFDEQPGDVVADVPVATGGGAGSKAPPGALCERLYDASDLRKVANFGFSIGINHGLACCSRTQCTAETIDAIQRTREEARVSALDDETLNFIVNQ